MKILFCGEAFFKAVEMLRDLLPNEEVFSCPSRDVPQVGSTVDVIVPLMHRLDAAFLQNTAARLIQQWGVGLEGVDIPAATEQGIPVCNVPADLTANADSTAELAVFLMLGVARRIHSLRFQSMTERRWGAPVGEALCGKTALIVGLGKVGTALASRLRAFGMHVEAVRRTPRPDRETALELRRVGSMKDLFDMVSKADFVASCIALSEETRGLFDKKLFHDMKPEAAFINISRGPVVNEEDLVDALKEGSIAAAGLDVFREEPINPTNPLLTLENVFVTPHIAGATRQTYEGIARIVRENILRYKSGKPLLHCVNANKR